jgi:predicted nucleotidyltransferase
MVTLSDIQNRKEQILEVAARHGASRIRVFGSVSRGDASPSSDVDLLVHLNDDATLLDQIGLKNDLEDLLGCNVDVVDDDAVFPAIRDGIMAEAVTL